MARIKVFREYEDEFIDHANYTTDIENVDAEEDEFIVEIPQEKLEWMNRICEEAFKVEVYLENLWINKVGIVKSSELGDNWSARHHLLKQRNTPYQDVYEKIGPYSK